jgi:hypothetical protein
MRKPINKNFHGVIDYAYSIVVPFLPEATGFNDAIPAKNLCRALGAGALTYTLLTKARWGMYPLIPFRKHLLMDAAVSLAAMASPWLLGFQRNSAARTTLLTVGVAGLAAALLTDPVEKDQAQQRYLFI